LTTNFDNTYNVGNHTPLGGKVMGESSCSKFQDTVSEHLVRYRSILDAMSKFQEASAHVNRAIAKSVTTCGCLKIKATKQPVPKKASLAEVAEYMKSHLEGNLCPTCLENIESELGTTLFYLTAVCTLLDLDLEKILQNENNRITTLGLYSLT
jgi:hypothetical protein